jgi:hypothetical protein
VDLDGEASTASNPPSLGTASTPAAADIPDVNSATSKVALLAQKPEKLESNLGASASEKNSGLPSTDADVAPQSNGNAPDAPPNQSIPSPLAADDVPVQATVSVSLSHSGSTNEPPTTARSLRSRKGNQSDKDEAKEWWYDAGVYLLKALENYQGDKIVPLFHKFEEVMGYPTAKVSCRNPSQCIPFPRRTVLDQSEQNRSLSLSYRAQTMAFGSRFWSHP